MSKTIKAFVAATALATLAACSGGQVDDVEEFVVVDPEPVTIEPTFTGKYK